MRYDIHTRSDLFSGVSLVIMIPEEELDGKALYTMQAEKPEFILPFRVRYVEGLIEISYQIEAHCKLQYIAGDCGVKEYTLLWASVLSPLLECGDWFMKPYSFVLNAEHLYYDKGRKTASYIYIPTVRDCSDYNSLKEMAAELTKQISVSDMALENKVLRAIMKDFSPKDFLQTLKAYTPGAAPPPAGMTVECPAIPAVEPFALPAMGTAGMPAVEPFALSAAEPKGTRKKRDEQEKNVMEVSRKNTQAEACPHDAFGDFVINIPIGGSCAGKSKDQKKNREKAEPGKPKEPQKSAGMMGLFGKRKKYDEERQNEAPPPHSQVYQIPQPPSQYAQYGGQPRCPLPEPYPPALNAPHSELQTAVQPQHLPYDPRMASEPQYAAFDSQFIEDVTQSMTPDGNGGKLWLVGSILLPALIDVKMDESEVFTIGRFDATVGRQQSNFEFERKTKAISRRHAAIERNADIYSIVDLSSSAGTFVNGQKLPPNTPYQLTSGCRVSFGSSGADYVWEE